MTTAQPPAVFEPGQQVHWTGLAAKFDHLVTIVKAYRAYLVIFGETPEDGRQVYDIDDPQVGGVVFGIPADQLHAEIPQPASRASTLVLVCYACCGDPALVSRCPRCAGTGCEPPQRRAS